MSQDRFDEARALARALDDGLQELRGDVSDLVADEVQRVGLTPDETRRVVSEAVAEALARVPKPHSGRPAWLAPAGAGFAVGVLVALAVLVLTGLATL